MSISTHNPYAWTDPDKDKFFKNIIQAENYAAQNHVELMPLYTEATMPFLDRLQELIDQDAQIRKQDGFYWLFDNKNEGICHGRTVRELMVNLVLTVC